MAHSQCLRVWKTIEPNGRGRRHHPTNEAEAEAGAGAQGDASWTGGWKTADANQRKTKKEQRLEVGPLRLSWIEPMSKLIRS